MPKTEPTISQDAPTVSKEAREAAAALLGYKDWGDATDYRLTSAQDRQRDETVQAFARFEAHLRTPAPMLMTQEWLDAKVAADPVAEVEACTPAGGEAGEMVADSGMSGEAVERAEWAWANLPVGPRKWTSLATHEKALVCHVITRLSNDTEAMRLLREARDCIEGEFGAIKLVQRIDALVKGGA